MEKCLKGVADASVNEMRLFHGTKQTYVDAITQQGFDWRLSGLTTGMLYGRGSYFHKNAYYSKNYTDCKTLILVKILVGEYTEGSATTVRPPAKDPAKPHENFYDSCVNSKSNPEIFVIFSESQTYPEYLIEY